MNYTKTSLLTGLTLAGFLFITVGLYAKEAPAAGPASAERDTQQALLDIQRELLQLDQQFEVIRQDLFFPKDDEVLFYLRNTLPGNFPLSSVALSVNGSQVYEHTYTDAEKIAFKFSSLQPLHRVNLATGAYQIEAKFRLQPGIEKVKTSSGSDGWIYRFRLNKESLPKFIEIELGQDQRSDQLAAKEKIW